MSSIKHLFDNSAGRDKIYTVPANRVWKVLYGRLTVASTAVGTSRRYTVRIVSEQGNIMSDNSAEDNQGASTSIFYNIKEGTLAQATVTSNRMNLPVANNLILLPGWKFIISDNNDQDTNDATELSLVYLDGGLSNAANFID